MDKSELILGIINIIGVICFCFIVFYQKHTIKQLKKDILLFKNEVGLQEHYKQCCRQRQEIMDSLHSQLMDSKRTIKRLKKIKGNKE